MVAHCVGNWQINDMARTLQAHRLPPYYARVTELQVVSGRLMFSGTKRVAIMQVGKPLRMITHRVTTALGDTVRTQRTYVRRYAAHARAHLLYWRSWCAAPLVEGLDSVTRDTSRIPKSLNPRLVAPCIV